MKLFLLFPLLLASILEYASCSSSSPSVIIIGAGMSGISAAKTLEDGGIQDFLILEATNRIGGRIHKTEFAGYTVEKGANWLHGVGGPMRNPLYDMSEEIHLRKFYSDFSNVSYNTYKQEGGLYKGSKVDAAFDKLDKTIEDGEKLAKKLESEENDNDDINDMSLLAFERLDKTAPKTDLERAIDFFDIDGELAEAPRIISLKHALPFPESYDFGEKSFFVADSRGFESLVHVIAKKFLSYDENGEVDDPRIKFNQVVREVKQSEGGVTITTEDGKIYESKLVIVSASLGVLQSDLISFKPQLPFWKRRAISEFSMAIYTKIFLKFPRTFWPVGNGTEFFIYVHQRRGYYAFWQHLNNEYPGSNIMFVTVVDTESIRVEQQSDEKTKAEIMEVLRKMFGEDIPEATDILIPRWYSDRLYQGTYSNWPTGYSQKRHNQLKAPVGQVYFTGEHTHSRYFGYASGAHFAGIKTARDVIKVLKNDAIKVLKTKVGEEVSTM